MSETIGRNPDYVRWSHELLFSIYCSFLFVWAEESRPFAWPTAYLYFWHPHAVALGRIDFLLFYSEVFLILASVLFLSLRLIRRFAFSRILLRTIAGAVAVAGFPLVCQYRQNQRLFLLDIELILAAVSFLLWVYRKWPVPAPLNVVLLIVHYSLWSFLSGEARIVDWRWPSGILDYAWLAYSALGLAYTLVWAAYLRHSASTEQLISRTAE
jgi:hypothetical protein